jgi:hypothetical protein
MEKMLMLKQFMHLIEDMGSMRVKTEDGGWVMPEDAGSEKMIYGKSLYELFFNRMANEVESFVEEYVAHTGDDSYELREYTQLYIKRQRERHLTEGMMTDAED